MKCSRRMPLQPLSPHNIPLKTIFTMRSMLYYAFMVYFVWFTGLIPVSSIQKSNEVTLKH